MLTKALLTNILYRMSCPLSCESQRFLSVNKYIFRFVHPPPSNLPIQTQSTPTHQPPSISTDVPSWSSSSMITIELPYVGVQPKFENIDPPPSPSRRQGNKMRVDVKPDLKRKPTDDVCCEAHRRMRAVKRSRSNSHPPREHAGPSILPLCVPAPQWYAVRGSCQSIYRD